MKNIDLYIHLVYCLFALTSPVLGQEQKPENTIQKAVYFAFGSPSLYASVNYEWRVFEKSKVSILPRLGIGLNIFQPSIGKEWNLNTGITGLYGKKKNKTEVALGIIHQFHPQYNFGKERDITKYKAAIYSGFGYRYQPIEKGVMFKLLITPTISINSDKWVIFPYAEMGLGYVFRREK